jgi:hypothetical protein
MHWMAGSRGGCKWSATGPPPVMRSVRLKSHASFGVANIDMNKTFALTLAASALFLAGCSTTHHVTKFEYKEVWPLDQVNELAKQGWRVVSVMHSDGSSDRYLMEHKVK